MSYCMTACMRCFPFSMSQGSRAITRACVYTVTRKQYDVHGHFVYHILAETTSSVDFRYTAMTMAPFTARAIGSQMDSRDTLRVSYHASPCVKTFFYCLFRNCLLPRTHKPNAPQTTSASALSDWITMHLGGLLHVYLVSDRPRHILKPSVNRVHVLHPPAPSVHLLGIPWLVGKKTDEGPKMGVIEGDIY